MCSVWWPTMLKPWWYSNQMAVDAETIVCVTFGDRPPPPRPSEILSHNPPSRPLPPETLGPHPRDLRPSPSLTTPLDLWRPPGVRRKLSRVRRKQKKPRGSEETHRGSEPRVICKNRGGSFAKTGGGSLCVRVSETVKPAECFVGGQAAKIEPFRR